MLIAVLLNLKLIYWITFNKKAPALTQELSPLNSNKQ